MRPADYQLEKQRRDVRQNIRSLFRQVQTDTLNIKARKQAITSAQSAVEATETGYRVGTRNIVEVLDAQKKSVPRPARLRQCPVTTTF